MNLQRGAQVQVALDQACCFSREDAVQKTNGERFSRVTRVPELIQLLRLAMPVG